MMNLNSLIGAAKAFVLPQAPAQAKAAGDDAPAPKMAADSLKLSVRPAAKPANPAQAEQLARLADDRELLSHLMAKAGSTAQRIKYHLEIRDLDRAVERVKAGEAALPADPGLANAVGGLKARMGQVDGALSDLTQKAFRAGSQQELSKIQLQIMDLERTRERLQGLAKAADQVAANPGADVETAKRLLHQAKSAGSALELSRLQVALEGAARGGKNDPAIANGQQKLANRIGAVEDQMRMLAEKAQVTTSQMELTKLQLEIDDLGRTREVLEGIQAQGTRVADAVAGGAAGGGRMAELLEAASRAGSATELVRLAHAASQVAR